MEDNKTPEVIYKFYLPENAEEEKIFRHANNYHSAIYELLARLRQEAKYGNDRSMPHSEFRELLFTILEQEEILSHF